MEVLEYIHSHVLSLPPLAKFVLGTALIVAIPSLSGRVPGFYSSAARLTMWSLTLPQVATTLAATLVGFHTFNHAGQRLIDGRILNAVFALMLTTAILGPALTEHFAPHMLEAPADRKARNAWDA